MNRAAEGQYEGFSSRHHPTFRNDGAMKGMMKTATIFVLLALGCLTACSTAPQRTAAAPPPFECTSTNPQVCELQREVHALRVEQAEQNAAIDQAERRRKARLLCEQVHGRDPERCPPTAVANDAAGREAPAGAVLLDAPAG